MCNYENSNLSTDPRLKSKSQLSETAKLECDNDVQSLPTTSKEVPSSATGNVLKKTPRKVVSLHSGKNAHIL